MPTDFPYQAGDDVRLVADPSHRSPVVEVHGQLAELRNGLRYSAAEIEPLPPSDEAWLDLPGYDGRYRLSSHGKLLSTHYHGRAGRERLLKPVANTPGNSRFYRLPPVSATGGPSETRTVGRLVAEHFLSPPPAGYERPCVRYLDGNHDNMRWDNLAWYDKKERDNDALSTALKLRMVLPAARRALALRDLQGKDAHNQARATKQVPRETNATIAARYGVDEEVIKSLAKQRGLARARPTSDARERIAAALTQGQPVAELALAFNVDRNTVYRIKRRMAPAGPAAGR